MSILTHQTPAGATALDLEDDGALTLSGPLVVTGRIRSTNQTLIALGAATFTTITTLSDTTVFTGTAASVEVYIPAAASLPLGDAKFLSAGAQTSIAIKSPNAAATASLTLAPAEGGFITCYNNGSANVLFGWGVGTNT